MNNKTAFNLVNVILFALTGAGFCFLVQAIFAEVISSFRTVFLILPAILTVGLLVYLLLTVNILPFKDVEKIKKHSFVHAIIFTSISVISLVTLIVITPIYFSITKEGDIYSAIYPIEYYVFDVVFIIFGALFLIFRNKILSSNIKKNPHQISVTFRILFIVFALFALYFLGLFIYSIFAFDTSKPQNFLGIIVCILLCAVPAVEMILYYFLYLPENAKNKRKKQLYTSCGIIITVSILLILFIIQSSINPQFIVESLQSMYPATFAASIKIGIILQFALGYAPGVIGLANYFYHSYKEQKANKIADNN